MLHPFRFYLVNKVNGTVFATDSASDSENFAHLPGWLVIDSLFGEAKSDGLPLEKILPYQFCPGCKREKEGEGK